LANHDQDTRGHYSLRKWWEAFKYLVFEQQDINAQGWYELAKEKKAMPVGTVLVTTKRYDLASCPEGYVIVRRMNYGEELQRTEMATKFTLGGGGSSVDKDNFSGALDINTTAVALWDFANLIIDHNITDDTDTPLNFKNPRDVKRLDSTVGKEIGAAIDEWNAVKETEDTKNS
jgi:hypothetical protein